MRIILLLIATTLFILQVEAQNTYSLKPFEVDKCEKFITFDKSVPREVAFTLKRKGNELFFVSNSQEWFDKLMKTIDGFSVEIVSKDQFVCGGNNRYLTEPIGQGILLEPLYEKDFKKNTITGEKGLVLIHIGTIPTEFISKEIEYNLIFINNKTSCFTRSNYNIDSYLWDL